MERRAYPQPGLIDIADANNIAGAKLDGRYARACSV
jgi:hypothetical protein